MLFEYAHGLDSDVTSEEFGRYAKKYDRPQRLRFDLGIAIIEIT